MTAPFQSKLIPHEKEIFDLWYHQRATLKMIQTYLPGKGVTISLAGLSGFIRRRKTKADPHKIEEKRKTAQKKKTSMEKAIEMLDALERQ